MITFNDLNQVSNEELVSCFNLAFSDYVLPAKLNLQQLEKKLYTEDINKDISVGAFDSNHLVGFVMHGERTVEKNCSVYNGGTGVIPSERGKSLTTRMYDFVLPILKPRGCDEVILEVIEGNTPAIKSYDKIGFELVRNLFCYKGELSVKKINTDVSIVSQTDVNIKELAQMGMIKPTWQNANPTILNLGADANYLLAYLDQELCGYCIINTINNRILQIAVKKRRRNQKIGSTLLHHMEQNISDSTSIINVETGFEKTNAFFESVGLKRTIQQHEMNLNV